MFPLNDIVENSETQELEELIMGLIINSGEARSLAYAALNEAKQGHFDTASELMLQSHQAINKAHQVQTKLIEDDEGKGKTKVSLILVHAQDHLMNAMLLRELVTELIVLHKKIK